MGPGRLMELSTIDPRVLRVWNFHHRRIVLEEMAVEPVLRGGPASPSGPQGRKAYSRDPPKPMVVKEGDGPGKAIANFGGLL